MLNKNFCLAKSSKRACSIHFVCVCILVATETQSGTQIFFAILSLFLSLPLHTQRVAVHKIFIV